MHAYPLLSRLMYYRCDLNYLREESFLQSKPFFGDLYRQNHNDHDSLQSFVSKSQIRPNETCQATRCVYVADLVKIAPLSAVKCYNSTYF